MESKQSTVRPTRYGPGFSKETVRHYRAEKALLPRPLPGESEARAQMSLAECEIYANSVLRTPHVKQNFNFRNRVKVTDGRGRDSGMADFSEDGRPIIKLPRFTRNQYYFLHELAHHLAGFGEEHGPKFTHTLLNLVRNEMGQVAYKTLKDSLIRNKVGFVRFFK